MCWTDEGSKICIAYNDGVVIVGSIKGDRLWRKDLGMRLQNVKWSPDGKTIIVVSSKTNFHCTKKIVMVGYVILGAQPYHSHLLDWLSSSTACVRTESRECTM